MWPNSDGIQDFEIKIPNGVQLSSRDLSGSLENNYEHFFKVIHCLECDNHIHKYFRQKFLTWFNSQETSQERRIVKVFVDTMSNDPDSLDG